MAKNKYKYVIEVWGNTEEMPRGTHEEMPVKTEIPSTVILLKITTAIIGENSGKFLKDNAQWEKVGIKRE